MSKERNDDLGELPEELQDLNDLPREIIQPTAEEDAQSIFDEETIYLIEQLNERSFGKDEDEEEEK